MQEIKEFSDYSALLEAAKSVGIKSQKLDEAVESYALPTGGKPFTFAKIELVDDGQMSHIRLVTDSGEKISIGKLLASPSFVEDAKDVKTVQQTTNKDKASFLKWFLSGERVNPSLPSNQAKCAMVLLNTKYTAELVEGFILPYDTVKTGSKKGNPLFCEKSEDVANRVVRKGFYRLIPA